MNFNYQISPLLIETLIVPQSVTDSIIEEAVEKFRNRFFPVWVNDSIVNNVKLYFTLIYDSIHII